MLLHAFPLDRRMWRGQLDGLGGVARVVAVDLPGFGASAASGAETRSMDELAQAVLALADALGWARFALAGASMGGYVAFATLRRARARVAGVCLADTRAENDSPEIQAARHADAARALAEGTDFYVARQAPLLVGKGAAPATIAEVQAMARGVSAATLAATLRGMAARPDARPELAGLAGLPTLVLGGADDALTPPASMQALAAAIPGAELAIVPGGHLAPLEHPDESNAALVRWLGRL
jgi:pimeloyl-ACP methyl ester carboxylesterase